MRLAAKSSRKDEGFTIIEVLIVLAIAGLIMVVVFLAVPALQRTSRNNALSADVNNMLSAIGSYMGNNNGSAPTSSSISLSTDKRTLTIGVSGTNNTEQATLGGNVSSLAVVPPASPMSLPLSASASPGEVQIVLGQTAKCNADGTGLQGGNVATARSYAILYVAESGSGNILKCVGS